MCSLWILGHNMAAQTVVTHGSCLNATTPLRVHSAPNRALIQATDRKSAPICWSLEPSSSCCCWLTAVANAGASAGSFGNGGGLSVANAGAQASSFGGNGFSAARAESSATSFGNGGSSASEYQHSFASSTAQHSLPHKWTCHHTSSATASGCCRRSRSCVSAVQPVGPFFPEYQLHVVCCQRKQCLW